MKTQFTVALFMLACVTLGSAIAADGKIEVPADPLAKAAFEVLDKSCARCHQVGRLEGRQQPVSNFGFILEFKRLTADRRYVIPGDPGHSSIYKRIIDQLDPYDVIFDGSSQYSPTPDDLKVLEAWIKSLSVGAPKPN